MKQQQHQLEKASPKSKLHPQPSENRHHHYAGTTKTTSIPKSGVAAGDEDGYSIRTGEKDSTEPCLGLILQESKILRDESDRDCNYVLGRLREETQIFCVRSNNKSLIKPELGMHSYLFSSAADKCLAGDENGESRCQNRVVRYEKRVVGYENNVVGDENTVAKYENRVDRDESRVVGDENKLDRYENRLVGDENSVVGNENRAVRYEKGVVRDENRVVRYGRGEESGESNYWEEENESNRKLYQVREVLERMPPSREGRVRILIKAFESLLSNRSTFMEEDNHSLQKEEQQSFSGASSSLRYQFEGKSNEGNNHPSLEEWPVYIEQASMAPKNVEYGMFKHRFSEDGNTSDIVNNVRQKKESGETTEHYPWRGSKNGITFTASKSISNDFSCPLGQLRGGGLSPSSSRVQYEGKSNEGDNDPSSEEWPVYIEQASVAPKNIDYGQFKHRFLQNRHPLVKENSLRQKKDDGEMTENYVQRGLEKSRVDITFMPAKSISSGFCNPLRKLEDGCKKKSFSSSSPLSSSSEGKSNEGNDEPSLEDWPVYIEQMSVAPKNVENSLVIENSLRQKKSPSEGKSNEGNEDPSSEDWPVYIEQTSVVPKNGENSLVIENSLRQKKNGRETWENYAQRGSKKSKLDITLMSSKSISSDFSCPPGQFKACAEKKPSKVKTRSTTKVARISRKGVNKENHAIDKTMLFHSRGKGEVSDADSRPRSVEEKENTRPNSEGDCRQRDSACIAVMAMQDARAAYQRHLEGELTADQLFTELDSTFDRKRKDSNSFILDYDEGNDGTKETSHCKRLKRNTSKPQPFKLRTEERGHMKEQEFAKKIADMLAEEERLRIPKAQDLPWTTDEPEILPKPPIKDPTKPVEFHLVTGPRAVERSEFNQYITEKLRFMEQQRLEEEQLRKIAEKEEIKMLRKEMIPHAQLMPYFDRPFIPKRSSKSLTVPKEPNFHDQQRKRAKCCGNEEYCNQRQPLHPIISQQIQFP